MPGKGAWGQRFAGWQSPVLLAALALGLSACSLGTQEANHSLHSASGEIKGYGVPAVDEPTLEAMLARCEAVERLPPQEPSAVPQEDIRRRCAQLRRTMGTQPGNAVRAGR